MLKSIMWRMVLLGAGAALLFPWPVGCVPTLLGGGFNVVGLLDLIF